MKSFVLKDASIVSGSGIELGDVLVIDGKIAEVGHGLEAEETIDCDGKHLFPGGIDTQVHFREPGMEHKECIESGSLAALFGGITSFLEMPNTKPATTSAAELDFKMQRAAKTSYVHYGFFVGASPANLNDLPMLEKRPGVPGIKVFAGSSTGDLMVNRPEDLARVFENGTRPIAFHSEDEERIVARKGQIPNPSVHDHPRIRDEASALMCTERLLALHAEHGPNRRMHILHISTAEEAALLGTLPANSNVTCEVTPQHLTFCAPDAYDQLGTFAQMNPPIREAHHREALWSGLDRDVFYVFGSDHAPHTILEKGQAYPASPSGMPGVETIFPVLLHYALSGRFSLEKLCRMLCEHPAELYGIAGKGRIWPGFDADLVLVDSAASHTVQASRLHSRCGWTPYEGMTLTGKIDRVYILGTEAVRGGRLVTRSQGSRLEFR